MGTSIRRSDNRRGDRLDLHILEEAGAPRRGDVERVLAALPHDVADACVHSCAAVLHVLPAILRPAVRLRLAERAADHPAVGDEPVGTDADELQAVEDVVRIAAGAFEVAVEREAPRHEAAERERERAAGSGDRAVAIGDRERARAEAHAEREAGAIVGPRLRRVRRRVALRVRLHPGRDGAHDHGRRGLGARGGRSEQQGETDEGAHAAPS
jgi:hypothetical protein